MHTGWLRAEPAGERPKRARRLAASRACWRESPQQRARERERERERMSGGVPRYRVVDPVRDANGHHPVDAAPAAQRTPLPDPSKRQTESKSLLGAATPMPRQPLASEAKVELLPRKLPPAPLPPRPRLCRVAPVATAAPHEPSDDTDKAKEAGSSFLTPEQTALVDALRARVADALSGDPAAARLGDESALHRFVCARQGSVADAEAMFRGRLEWHKEVDLDRLWSEYRPSPGMPVGAAAAIAEDCFYAGVSGWTKDGSPLMVERLGRADLAGITREGEDLQRLVLYSYMLYLETMFRTCTRLSREKGRFVRGMIVLDMAGVSMSTIWNIGVVKAVVTMGTANFPELTDKVFIVNAPWAAVKGESQRAALPLSHSVHHTKLMSARGTTQAGISSLPCSRLTRVQKCTSSAPGPSYPSC